MKHHQFSMAARRQLAIASAIIGLAGAGNLLAQTQVDLELSLVVDVSGSVDNTEYALQRDGYVESFRSTQLQSGITAGRFGRIAVNVVQFGSTARESIPFTIISSSAEANAFADLLANMARAESGSTNIISGINAAADSLRNNTITGTRTVIDVSGDGANNVGSDTELAGARDAALAGGVNTINGVVIGDIDGSLRVHYQAFVIGGTAAFVETAVDFASFESTVGRKLIREIANPPTEVGVGGRRVIRTITVTDLGAIRSALFSGLPVAMVQRDLGLMASRASIRDVNARLFRLRSREEEMMPAPEAAPSKNPVGKSPVGSGKSPDKSPLEPDPIMVQSDDDRFHVFANAEFNSWDTDGLYSNVGVEADVWSGSAGFEYEFCPAVTGGFAFSLLDMDADLAHELGDVELQGWQVSPYLSFYKNRFYADVLYSYGAFDHEIDRNTLLGSRVRADTDSSSHTIEFNTGYNFHCGPVITGPLAGFDYVTGDVDGYEEEGESRARLRVDDQDFESWAFRVGWQVSLPIKTRVGKITPQVRVGYVFESLEASDETRVALLQSPTVFVRNGRIVGEGQKFEAEGHPNEQDLSYLTVGAGVRWAFRDNMAVVADYEGQFGDDVRAHSGSLRFSLSF